MLSLIGERESRDSMAVGLAFQKNGLALSCFLELHETHAATRFSGLSISPPLLTGTT